MLATSLGPHTSVTSFNQQHAHSAPGDVMKTCNESTRGSGNRGIISVVAAAVVTLTASASPANAHDNPPLVPQSLQVQQGNTVFLKGHAFGTQNYICLPAGTGFAWTLFTPEATLFNRGDKQIITHFFSPNPPATAILPTWQHSRDSSAVWASAAAPPSFDPAFVAPGAVPWLLLQADATQDGPTGGDTLSGTTFIHRVNTSGGLAPATGCASLVQVGAKKFVPYEADYFFYTNGNDNP
jgi:hypothetical protein